MSQTFAAFMIHAYFNPNSLIKHSIIKSCGITLFFSWPSVVYLIKIIAISALRDFESL